MTAKNDVLNRYTFDNLHVRAELVQLQRTFQEIITPHDYPLGVQQLLGELIAATCLLTATIKFEGEITVQLQGDGPISYLVVNGNHKQEMRAIARLSTATEQVGLKNLIGKGNMIITIRPHQGEAYQGVVALEQACLSDCLAHYFEVSEQIPTKIWLFVDPEKQQAAGSLVQLLPDGEDKAQQQLDFEHLCQLTNTIKAEEIFTLDAPTLLHRLYHQEAVRIYEPVPVTHKCGCSADKCLSAIAQMAPIELKKLLEEQGNVSMTCDYCKTTYLFDESKLSDFIHQSKH